MDHLIRQRYKMPPSAAAAFAASQQQQPHPKRTQTPQTITDYDDGDDLASADEAYNNPISPDDDQYDSNDILSVTAASSSSFLPPPPPLSSRAARLAGQMRPIAKSVGGEPWQPVNAQRTSLPMGKRLPTPTVSAGRKAPTTTTTTTTDRSVNEINSIDANANEDIFNNNIGEENPQGQQAKRLTLLDEPALSMGEDFTRGGQRSSAFGADNSMGDFSNSRSRQTFLPTTTGGAGSSNWPPTPTLLLQEQQQQSDYHLSPSLLLLSFLIIVFGAYLRFKNRNKRSCWPKRWLGQKLSSLALKASGKSAPTRRNNKADDSLEECCAAELTATTPQKLLGCAATSGCSIKLVERKASPALPSVGFSGRAAANSGGGDHESDKNPRPDDCDAIQSAAAAGDDDDDDDDASNHRKGLTGSKSLGRKNQASTKEGLSTMVILKRRFAKSPCLVASVVARSTRPRVKLLTARARKFIDDEAEELRAKRLMDPTCRHSFGSRVLSFVLAPLAATGQTRPQEKDEANEAREEEQIQASTQLLSEQQREEHENEEGEDSNSARRCDRLRCRADDSSASIEVEIHREINSGQSAIGEQHQQAADKMIEMTFMGGGLTANGFGLQSGLAAADQQQLQPPSASHNQHQSQLSPSPVIADGCSSLSGCTSLFSPSPIEHQPSCGCILSRDRLAGAAADLAALSLLARSKSQQGPAGSAACRLIEPNPAVYRPCCSSVSPSALNQHSSSSSSSSNNSSSSSNNNNHHQTSNAQSPAVVGGESVIDTGRSPPALTDDINNNAKFYQAQQPPLANYYQPLGSAVGDFASSKLYHQQHDGLYGLSAPNAASIAMGKCSSHIKRQYENYYDDERQDAYQRLTASIGIELGLNFDDDPHDHHHHHHHHHHEATHTVGHAHTLSYAASNMAELLHFPRFDCHHSSANVDLSAASYLPSGDGTEFQQPMLPVELKSAPIPMNQQQQEMLDSSSLCRSPLCACQAAAAGTPVMAPPPPPPPMSILVQQPSMATPPPPPAQAQVARSHNHQVGAAPQSPVESSQQQQHYQHYPQYQSNSAGVSPTIKHSPSPAEERRSAPESATAATSILAGGELANSTGCSSFGATRGNMSPGTLSATAGIRPKWRQRRRLSQMQQESAELAASGAATDCFPPSSCANSPAASTAAAGWPASSVSRQPRRTSIAGDQVSQDAPALSGQQTHCPHHRHYLHQASQCEIAAHSANVAGDVGSSGVGSNGSASRQHLQHRASIALDGTWNQASIYNQLRFGADACLSQFEQQQAHLHQLALQSSQRPSEASLYDPQYCSDALRGKSNYSSSGGSSSGIGISGSICTNASTGSVLQQYASFATTKTDGLLIGDYGHLQADQSATSALCGYPHHLQCNYYLHGAHPSPADLLLASGGCQIASCPSRKFSLPVQLESQTSSDRLSPTTSRAKLLFEKNLHRVDSASLAAGAASTLAGSAAAAAAAGNAQQICRPRGLPGEAVAIRNNCGGQLESPSSRHESQQQQLQRFGSASSRPTFESRRSSQTITRQSSFWLEDNSVGSILSLTTSGAVCMQSEDGSQLDVNQLPQDERIFASQQQQQQRTQQQQSQPGSQRPSISSSLVLSGDSIESVRQKPLVAQAPVEETQPVRDNLLLQDENDVFKIDTNINDGDQEQQQREAESTSSNNNSSDNSASQRGEAQADADVSLPSPPIQTATSSAHKESTSSSSLSASAMRDKRFNSFRTLAHMRNRLSSSSTASSTTSSPSPDFGGRPSERILGLASKSGTISKRRLFGKLRSRRYTCRLGASTGNAFEQANNNNNNSKIAGAAHRHSAPNSSSSFRRRGKQASKESAKSEGYTRYSTETDQCSATSLPLGKQSEPEVDGEFLNTPSERPISDLNSSSLERQCRELWKLRATLHDDTCVGDNWSNYHQRLNRRYDSGYKSIENQLSSSIEGNVLPANLAGIQAPPGRSPATPSGACAQQPRAPGSPHGPTIDASLLVRPQSGCSGSIWRPLPSTAEAAAITDTASNVELANLEQAQQNFAEMETEYAKFTSTIVETDEDFSYQQEQEGSIDDTIDGKLAELDLDDGALECLLGDAMDRECQSRSSKSSNEDDSRAKGLDGDNQNNDNKSG